MAITPLGSVIYSNQNMTAVATKQADFQSRLELQSLAASEFVKEAKKEVEKIRPAEESYKLDPENEHEKKNFQDSGKDRKNHEQKNHDDYDDEYRLNISV